MQKMLKDVGQQGLRHRLVQLEARHAQLEARIDAELARPLPDLLILQRLKRRKLDAKDEMADIGGVLRTLERPPATGAA